MFLRSSFSELISKSGDARLQTVHISNFLNVTQVFSEVSYHLTFSQQRMDGFLRLHQYLVYQDVLKGEMTHSNGIIKEVFFCCFFFATQCVES